MTNLTLTPGTTSSTPAARRGPFARVSAWIGRMQAALSDRVHARGDDLARTYRDPRLTVRRVAMVGEATRSPPSCGRSASWPSH